MPSSDPVKRAEYQRAYRATDEGRAVRRAVQKKYQATEEAQAVEAARNERYRQVRADLQCQVDAVKLLSGCVDCGYREHAVALDFDHLTDDKVAKISDLVNRMRPWSDIQTEMAKCEVVCSNCHRVRTRDRSQYTASPGRPAN